MEATAGTARRVSEAKRSRKALTATRTNDLNQHASPSGGLGKPKLLQRVRSTNYGRMPFGPGIASVEDWVQACDGLQVAIAEDATLSKYLSGSVLTGPSLADAQFAAFEVHRRLFSSPAPLPRVTHRTRRFPAIRSDTFHRHSPLPASEGPQSVSARQLHLGHPPPRCVPHLFVCVSVHFQLARS